MMCTKSLSPIFMLTYFTNLLFGGFDAAILFSWCNQEVNISGHETLYYCNICRKFIDTSFSNIFRAL